jgi:hypothetical protein
MQTSIEWLFEEYKLVGMLTTAMVDKAQEIHKQEIIEAWIVADNELQRKAAEQYYQETFKKD